MIGVAGARRREFFMGRIGIPELLVILFIVILIFGASRLPELGKGLGKGIRNFKDATKEGLGDKHDV
jgi:sec-independent protein translocase protein TatA